VFEPLGVRSVTTWSRLNESHRAQLATYDGVYVGGGNTYRLIHALRQGGLDDVLVSYIGDGGAFYGGSAGAIALGKDIDTAMLADDRNEVGLTDTRGLDLLGGWSVACHFRPQDVARTQAFSAERGLRLLALPEQAGIVVEGHAGRVCGERVLAVDGGRATRQDPGSLIGMLAHPED
jgi:dipeptidase E